MILSVTWSNLPEGTRISVCDECGRDFRSKKRGPHPRWCPTCREPMKRRQHTEIEAKRRARVREETRPVSVPGETVAAVVDRLSRNTYACCVCGMESYFRRGQTHGQNNRCVECVGRRTPLKDPRIAAELISRRTDEKALRRPAWQVATALAHRSLGITLASGELRLYGDVAEAVRYLEEALSHTMPHPSEEVWSRALTPRAEELGDVIELALTALYADDAVKAYSVLQDAGYVPSGKFHTTPGGRIRYPGTDQAKQEAE